MKKIFILVLAAYSLLSFGQSDDSLTVVAVGEAEVVLEKILVEKIKFKDGAVPADTFTIKEKIDFTSKIGDVIRNDFKFYSSYFSVVAPKTSGTSFENIDYDVYKQQGINYVVRLQVSKSQGSNKLSYKLYKVLEAKEVFTFEFNLTKNLREAAHVVSDNVYRSIVGKEPIFKHKIVFVSDANRASGTKELYIMDFDGANVKQLTWHGGIVISPSVSLDGSKVLYSLIDEKIRRQKNINLRLLDLRTGKSRLISKRRGINSGAVFSEDGESIILTLSHQGNAELYRMNLLSSKLERLTKNSAPDVDPSINGDGSILTFLSARPGKPMIYTMNPSAMESEVKRISYVGRFNATPRFAPNGKEIVFSSWLDSRFDLFKINSDGSGLARLTKDFGSNEDPDYSKDGQFIIFTSQRVLSEKKALQNVYIMDTEGKIIGSLTKNFGKCISPRWSKSL